MSSSSPDVSAGVFGLVIAFLATAVIMTWVTESYAHWPFILAGILVGLWAVQSINK